MLFFVAVCPTLFESENWKWRRVGLKPLFCSDELHLLRAAILSRPPFRQRSACVCRNSPPVPDAWSRRVECWRCRQVAARARSAAPAPAWLAAASGVRVGVRIRA